MLTPADLRKPQNVSGFKHVGYVAGPSRGNNKPYYQAYANGGRRGDWKGPARPDAFTAALDYCDYVNHGGNGVSSAPSLKSAGHKRGATPATRKETRRHKALRLKARDAMAALRACEESEGSSDPGKVYLIGEEYPTAFPPRDPSRVNISTFAVKIGHTKDDRLKGLQTGNPRKLVLLAERPGSKDDERALHAKYLPDNILGEWFRPTMPLLLEFGLREAIRGVDRIQVEGVVV